MRARMSVTEPAPNGTTTVTRWVGQLCARTGAVETTPVAIVATAPNTRLKIRFIRFLPRSIISRVQLVETPTKILEHDGSGITSRPARNRAPGMSRGTGLVEPRDRHAVLRPACGRPERRRLRGILRPTVTGAVPVVRISAFQVERALHHTGKNLVVG